MEPVNRTIYRSDNLPVLQALDTACIDLIATDPPFNTGRNFSTFSDKWNWARDVEQEWVEAIQDKCPAAWSVIQTASVASGDDMAAYLCWLGVRLIECHRVLKYTGSLYLHTDTTAQAYVKCFLDALFDRRNFRNEIAWCYFGPSNVKRQFPRKHDTILFYSKGNANTFNREDVRIPYKILNPGLGGIFGPGNNLARIEELRRIGKVVEDYWIDIFPIVNQPESTGYPTQKPLELYERIIKASSNPGDIVLDPFCGSGTTLVAAERLGRQWVGIDVYEGVYDWVQGRLGSVNVCMAI